MPAAAITLTPVRLATWNVNSAKARQFRLIDWLDRAQPDVAFLQETKLGDADFDALFADDLFRRDYRYAHVGQGRWNGVAILSKVGLDDVSVGLGPAAGPLGEEARAVGATCGGLRVWSVYVPNGRTVDDPMYEAKLTWLGSAGRRGRRRGAEGALRGRRRLQHRPGRRRRLGPVGLRRGHPRHRPRSGRRSTD